MCGKKIYPGTQAQETSVFEEGHARCAEDEHEAHKNFQDMGRSILQDAPQEIRGWFRQT